MNSAITPRLLGGRSLDRRSLVGFFGFSLAGFCVAAIFIILNATAVSPWSPTREVLSDTLPFFTLLIGLPSVVAVLFIPVGLIKILRGSKRGFWVATTFGAAIAAVALIYAIRLASEMQSAGFQHLALQSNDLVQAIKAFEAENKTPPPNLGALVPRYLARIPNTGMAAYREYIYTVLDQSAYWKGNRWKLTVRANMFDEFCYLPKQNYCEIDGFTMKQNANRCGPIQLLGDWAYYHL